MITDVLGSLQQIVSIVELDLELSERDHDQLIKIILKIREDIKQFYAVEIEGVDEC